MKKKLKTILLNIIWISTVSFSQSVTLDGQFYPYSTYYISSFNLSTGESTVPLFRYRLIANEYPVTAKVYFKASFLSPQLGINNRTTLIELESNAFQMNDDIVFDSRKFSENTTMIFDEANPPNNVQIRFRSLETIDATKYDNVLSSIMTTGKLPDGEYRFELKTFSGTTDFDLSPSDEKIETIIVETPSGVNLESPGGSLADTSFNIVYTTFPSFNWNKGYCNNCETYIRVAQFKPEYHSSLEEALRDERTLPFDQSKEWMKLQNVSTYQYPTGGVRPLENGKVYVWQIKTMVPTTDGMEDEVSEIYAFKIADPSLSTKLDVNNPIIKQIKDAIGVDKYNSFFQSGGALERYSPTGEYLVNNSNVDQSTVQNILKLIKNKNVKVNSIKVENN